MQDTAKKLESKLVGVPTVKTYNVAHMEGVPVTMWTAGSSSTIDEGPARGPSSDRGAWRVKALPRRDSSR